MRKEINFGRPCASFPRKIFKENYMKRPLSRTISEKVLNVLRNLCKEKRRGKESLGLFEQKGHLRQHYLNTVK